eukprot:1286791-Rhodomonas_salina.2
MKPRTRTDRCNCVRNMLLLLKKNADIKLSAQRPEDKNVRLFRIDWYSLMIHQRVHATDGFRGTTVCIKRYRCFTLSNHPVNYNVAAPPGRARGRTAAGLSVRLRARIPVGIPISITTRSTGCTVTAQ